MSNPRGFLEDNYGSFSQAEQALIDLVIDLSAKVERLEATMRLFDAKVPKATEGRP